jgi:hypothetical protein
MTQWDILRYDMRVRKRMLRAQHLTETQLDRHLQQLPDLETQAETVLTTQPAFGQRGGRDAAAAPRTPTLQRTVASDVSREATPLQASPAAPVAPASPTPPGVGFAAGIPAEAPPAVPVVSAPEQPGPAQATSAGDPISSSTEPKSPGSEPMDTGQPPGSSEGPS